MSTTKETTPSQCALLRLPNESLSEILMACDPEDALRMAQTCRTLHLLSDSKHLWLALLAKLDYDQAPDVGPHVDLGSLQAKEVKRIVVRALTSYNNWCCPDGPRITREQTVQLESHQLFALRILPGCQYLIVQSSTYDYLGVWDIKRETLAARHPCHMSLLFTAHDCALLRGGKIARFAFLRDEDSDHIEVVDFDLLRGHATLLFSESIPNATYFSSLKVREEAVLVSSDYNIALISPETGKIAKLTVENYDIDFDIVRGSLICVFSAIDGTVRLFVAKLSRIFEHTQGTEPIPFNDICEICRVLTFIQPNTDGNRYTLAVCDPMGWGSTRPCCILLAHIGDHGYVSQGNMMVQVHRLFLEECHNGSNFALTYDSSSNCVTLGESSNHPLIITRPSIPGRWMLSGGRGSGNYNFMVNRCWEDDVCLSPLDIFPSAIGEEAERFSGTQIWYLGGGNCVLHFYD